MGFIDYFILFCGLACVAVIWYNLTGAFPDEDEDE